MIVLIFLALLVVNGESAKILGVFPMAAPSHYILGNALLRGLAEKGHDVTMISAFEEKNPPKKGSYRNVVLTGFHEGHAERAKFMLEMGQQYIAPMVFFFSMSMLEHTEQTLNHTNVQKLLRSEEKFDVVIVEQFMNEAVKALAAHYDAPLVVLSTLGANPWVNFLVGNPSPPSYISDLFLSYSSDMCFGERVKNSLVYLLQYSVAHLYTYPRHAQLAKKYFPHLPPLEEVIYNTSLVLMNSHPSTNQPVPYVPNMIDIGGFHIQPSKKLPKDLQDFLDGAKEGVVYFSMGSNIRSAYLPKEKRDALLNAFAKLKQKVLWKWEEDVLPGQPPNVKLAKWLPQQDILAHPNVKLFITHGGLLSTLEAVYHGVPLLAIPVAGDQKLNAQRIENQGWGLLEEYELVSEETLSRKLQMLLGGPKYKLNAQSRSKFFHDRQVGAMDTATYWVEYVIRHKGAPHLQVAGVDMPLYKYLLLDVVAVVGAICLIALFLVYYVTKSAIGVFCGGRNKKVKTH